MLNVFVFSINRLIKKNVFHQIKDTLKDNILCNEQHSGDGPIEMNNSACLASMIAPIYFVIFVLMAQFVLVNVVVAVLMKHLDVMLLILNELSLISC